MSRQDFVLYGCVTRYATVQFIIGLSMRLLHAGESLLAVVSRGTQIHMTMPLHNSAHLHETVPDAVHKGWWRAWWRKWGGCGASQVCQRRVQGVCARQKRTFNNFADAPHAHTDHLPVLPCGSDATRGIGASIGRREAQTHCDYNMTATHC